MGTNDGRVSVLNLADSLELYYDLLEHSKGLDQHIRMLRDGILRAMSERQLDQVQVDGYQASRQLRHHAPQLNEDLAAEILEQQGRLDECLVQALDEEKAREVIEELFRHGALSKDDLPYIYVKPTEALVVRPVEAAAERTEERRRVHRAA